MSVINLNTQDSPPATGNEAIPAGSAIAVMTKSELKETSAKNGSTSLHMWFTILDGEHVNKKMYVAENFQNTNPQAMEIGKGRISSVAVATGHPQGVQNSEEMHNKPFELHWGYDEPQGSWGAKNFIRFAKPASGTPAADAANVEIPAQSNTPATAQTHVASSETSAAWPGAEQPVQPAQPAQPTQPVQPAVAEILPAQHPTLSAAVLNPTTQKYESTDSATGARYNYEHDQQFHLIPGTGAAQPTQGAAQPPAW